MTSIFKQQREMVGEKIIETAVRLFREKSYDSVSISEITQTVGIAKGTFYNFFSTKRDVLMRWAQDYFQSMDLKKAINPGHTIEDNLFSVIEIMVDEMEGQGPLFASFLSELIPGDGDMESQFDMKSIFSSTVRLSADFDRVSDGFDNKMNVLNHALFMAVIEWFREQRPMSGLAAHLKNIVKICLYGMMQ